MRAAISRLMPGDTDGQEEVLALARTKVWRSLPTFRGDSRFSTWCHMIASTCCLTELRVRSKRYCEVSFDAEPCSRDGVDVDYPSIEDSDYASHASGIFKDETPVAEERLDNIRLAQRVSALLDDLKQTNSRAHDLFVANKLENVSFMQLAKRHNLQRSKVADEVAFVEKYLREQTGQAVSRQ